MSCRYKLFNILISVIALRRRLLSFAGRRCSLHRRARFFILVKLGFKHGFKLNELLVMEISERLYIVMGSIEFCVNAALLSPP